MPVKLNYLSDYAESVKFITFVVFLFQIIENCKAALYEKMDNFSPHAVIQYLGIKGLFSKGVCEDMVATLEDGAGTLLNITSSPR